MFSVDHLNHLRRAELDELGFGLAPGATILEIGAGTGEQALSLARRGHDVVAIDLEASDYSAQRVFPVKDYDGRHIPSEDASFDLVFSSNVLEHVADLTTMHAEIRRVLKPSGRCLHVLPTHGWRFWTMVTALPASLDRLVRMRKGSDLKGAIAPLASELLLRPHGERGNALTELRLFRPAWWRENFRQNGFEIVEDRPVGLFYTGHMLLGPRLSMVRRRALASTFGSATHLFCLQKAEL